MGLLTKPALSPAIPSTSTSQAGTGAGTRRKVGGDIREATRGAPKGRVGTARPGPRSVGSAPGDNLESIESGGINFKVGRDTLGATRGTPTGEAGTARQRRPGARSVESPYGDIPESTPNTGISWKVGGDSLESPPCVRRNQGADNLELSLSTDTMTGGGAGYYLDATWMTGLGGGGGGSGGGGGGGLHRVERVDEATIAVSGEFEKKYVVAVKDLTGDTLWVINMGKEQVCQPH